MNLPSYPALTQVHDNITLDKTLFMQCVFMSLYDSKSQTAILMDVYVTTVM